MNMLLAAAVLEALSEKGVREYCVCPGARNAPLIALLRESSYRVFYFFDERSAAFFALGRIRSLGRQPVAVVTTSGTAVGELLPATMEAHYSGLPLVLLTADRPRSFRGTGAPQTAEQVGIFGIYVAGSLDLEGEEYLEKLPAFRERDILKLPFHLNVGFDEPLLGEGASFSKDLDSKDLGGAGSKMILPAALSPWVDPTLSNSVAHVLPSLIAPAQEFFRNTQYPIAIISLLHPDEREGVAELLLICQIPTYFEGVSGLREDPRMEPFRIHNSDGMMERAHQADYPVDGVLRIGGVPTLRLWRDLESKFSYLNVLSLAATPYSGLSRSTFLITGDLSQLCAEGGQAFRQELRLRQKVGEAGGAARRFLASDQDAHLRLQALLLSEPKSEPGMVYALSKLIAREAEKKSSTTRVYLGNSLPIREWDLVASKEFRADDIWASRGLNGIDGQISTFLGYAKEGAANWALVGDLTALYDMQGPWVLPQLLETQVNLVIMNNGGGKIFSKMFSAQEFQNIHHLRFSALADLWTMNYLKWEAVPSELQDFSADLGKSRMIELTPDEEATSRFWESYQRL